MAEIIIYVIGMVMWIGFWYLSKGFTLLKSNPLLWLPFVLVFFVLIINTLFVYYSPAISTFAIEQELLQVVERNTSQLIIGIYGVLILAATISSFYKRQFVTKNFFIFQMMALGFVVAGVLQIYWLPLDHPELITMLRSIKTVFYAFAISCFLAGMMILITTLINSLVDEPENLKRRKTDHE